MTALDIEIEAARRQVAVATRHLRSLLLTALARRDGTLCHYCDVPTILTHEGHPRRRTLDHVIPQSFGGKDTLDNLVLSCQSCNSSKGAQVDRSQLCPHCRGRTPAYEVTP
jgi:5-methylcytosine-specific restriction endonuclease McrA